MHLKSLKDFTLGKPKDKPGGRPGERNASARKTALMEEKMNGRTKDPSQMAQKVQGPAGTPGGDEHPRPHRPLGELSIGPKDLVEDVSDILPVIEEEIKEPVKLVEMNLDAKPALAAAAPEPAPTPAPAPADPGNPLSGLFSTEEEEENPLANLIRTLPDYTTHEIVEDLNEIKKIINEWQRK